MLTLLLFIGLGTVMLLIYNINWKPKNFPKGPLSLPLIGSLYVLGTEPHKNLMTLKKKYGGVFRIDFGSLRGIVLTDYQIIKDAFALPAFNDRPIYEVVEHYRGKNYNKGLVWSSGEVYEDQRRFISKSLKSFGFGKSSMESDILEHLNDFFNVMDKEIGKPIVNRHFFKTLSVKPVWRIVTGGTGTDDGKEFANAVDAVNELTSATSSAGGALFFPGVSKLFPNLSGWNAVIKSGRRINDFADRSVETHRKSKWLEDPRDLIDAYIQKILSTTEGRSSFFGEKAYDQLSAGVADLFITGTETVSTALSWFAFLMVLYPEVQHKMQEEIDRVVGRHKSPSLGDRLKMVYTESFIMELLRYSGFVPLASPHVVSEEVNFQGYIIPKGTIVVPNIYGVLHDPDIWDQPDSFIPERFLTDNGTSIDKHKAILCSFAFGSGKRRCLGENLARDELFLFITGLCQRYTFTEDTKSPKPKLETTLGVTLHPKPHPMIIHVREIQGYPESP